ncbi:MAG TPA: hypothetical protein VMR06_08660 [Dokdonella sp.]|nr:hypothetical protein [Dokdonella sp.]
MPIKTLCKKHDLTEQTLDSPELNALYHSGQCGADHHRGHADLAVESTSIDQAICVQLEAMLASISAAAS